MGIGYSGKSKYCSIECRPACSVEHCVTPIRGSSNFCAMHYMQMIRKKNPHETEVRRSSCQYCGDEISAASRRPRKFCSVSCAHASRTRGVVRKTEARCALCGAAIPLSRGDDGRLPREDVRWCRDCGRDSPEAIRFKRYGITPDEYSAALVRGCAICKCTDKELHVDHDHSCCPGRTFRTCGKCVRGLICGPCNRALGMMRDDVDILASAIAYLNRRKQS